MESLEGDLEVMKASNAFFALFFGALSIGSIWGGAWGVEYFDSLGQHTFSGAAFLTAFIAFCVFGFFAFSAVLDEE